MSDELIKQLIKRLDLLLSIKVNPFGDDVTSQDKIKRFSTFGFTPTEIAKILDSTGNKISKQLYVIKNKKIRKNE